jgi:N-acetylneuraminic acid mutarotase
MASQRWGHTATLLPDGKVLVAGGANCPQSCPAPLNTAELYDPATGTWSPTGNMSVAHWEHTATLLADGNVLVAGGYSGPGLVVTATAELYDPATGVWSRTGSMQAARYAQAAATLADGRVLVAGGLGPSNPMLASAEIYDPASGGWSSASAMSTARAHPTATSLPGGTVLVAGGCGDVSCLSTGISSAELYNPSTGAWTPTGSLMVGRGEHTATLLPGGQVLVAGGCCEPQTEISLSQAELYNPATGVWSPTGPMAAARSSQTSTLLPNGQVLVTGGCCSGGFANSSAERYTPGPSPLAVIEPTSLPFGDQSVAVAGPAQSVTVTNTGRLPLTVNSVTASGADVGDFAFSTSCTSTPVSPGSACAVDVTFTPLARGARSATLTIADDAPSGPQNISLTGNGTAGSAWLATGAPVTGRSRDTATLLSDGQVLIAGGCAGGDCASAELYTPRTRTWTATGNMTTARYAQSATLLPNGKVLVAGGCCVGTSALDSAELYDPPSGTWAATGSMHTVRQDHTATLLPNGAVLVTGGCNYACGPGSTQAEVYDPATGVWTSVAPMAVPRAFHSATLLPNGTVLVAGGCCAVTSSAELFNPGTATWSPTGALNAGRADHTATLLPTGKVLVAGGYTQFCTIEGCGTATQRSAELYDPSTGAWSLTGRMNGARGAHTATLLPTGLLLVAGGCSDDPDCFAVTASAEVYSPASGTWTTTSPMGVPRSEQTATLLRSGLVLEADGCCAGTASAELYLSPLVNVAPGTARAGQTVSVSGSRFPAPAFVGQDQVQLYLDRVGTPLLTATLAADGSFSGALVVPPGATPGPHTLIAVSRVTGASTGIPLRITP